MNLVDFVKISSIVCSLDFLMQQCIPTTSGYGSRKLKTAGVGVASNAYKAFSTGAMCFFFFINPTPLPQVIFVSFFSVTGFVVGKAVGFPILRTAGRSVPRPVQDVVSVTLVCQ